MDTKRTKTEQQARQKRHFFLLDTSACACIYDAAVPDESYARKAMTTLIAKRGENRAFLYLPNFCVAEVFNTFAKWHFRQKKISPSEYDQIKKAFRLQVSGSRFFYNYQLNRYHVLNTDYIVQAEHSHKLNDKKNFLSTLDILIIAMGIELAKIHGDSNFLILTNDGRIKKICNHLKKLTSQERSQRGISDSVVFPRCKIIGAIEPKNLLKLFG